MQIDFDELNKRIESPKYSIYSVGQRAEWIEECIRNASEDEIEDYWYKERILWAEFNIRCGQLASLRDRIDAGIWFEGDKK